MVGTDFQNTLLKERRTRREDEGACVSSYWMTFGEGYGLVVRETTE